MAETKKIIINPETDALLVIDVQPTFMPGGGLPIMGGQYVVPVIRDRLMSLFPKRRRFASKDRHPRGHISLASSYEGIRPMTQLMSTRHDDSLVRRAPHAKFSTAELVEYLAKVPGQILWPDHAIAGQDEAELHPDLPESEFGYVLVKGTDPACDSYSAFFDNLHRPTELADVLRDRGVRRVFVCGLAFDFCVAWTALGAVECGFETYVIEDATRAVDIPAGPATPGSVEATREIFERDGVKVVNSDDLALAT